MSAPEPGGGVLLVWTTCPDAEAASDLARALVEERLAACGNVLPGVTSIYRWRGTVETAGECLLLLKTRAERLEELSRRLHEIHSYEVPELIAVAVERGAPAYLQWVVETTQPEA